VVGGRARRVLGHPRRDATVRAFYLLLDGDSILPRGGTGDPVVAAWRRHLRDHPLQRGQDALGLRRWLDAGEGEAPCPAQAACWLDVKRTPTWRCGRRWAGSTSPRATPRPTSRSWRSSASGPLPLPLGPRGSAEPGAAAPEVLDGEGYTSVALDFGPGSVDGWLARLVAGELGLDDRPLDENAREVTVHGRRVALTRLEFGVLARLDAADGRTVSRADLLREVWGHELGGASNVVDVAVRSLRGKLGDGAVLGAQRVVTFPSSPAGSSRSSTSPPRTDPAGTVRARPTSPSTAASPASSTGATACSWSGCC
jgi:hypothetical protein